MQPDRQLLLCTKRRDAIHTAFPQPEVSFDGITGYAAVQFGDRFEINAVPKPATVFGALGLITLVGWRERRRFSDCLRRGIPS